MKMSKFHSSVTRRDFMKALGFGAAGIGAAAATAPVFHDLDEVISAPTSTKALPWYVKERELMNPTTEIDWSLLKRPDNRYAVQGDLARSHYPSYDRYNDARAAGSAKREERYAANEPGYDHKWRALNNGKSDRADHPDFTMAGLDPDALGDSAADMGLPNWTGTPEEARRLMTAAIRYFGIAYVGFAELNSQYRDKIVMYTTRSDRNARAGDTLDIRNADRYVYEDVPRAFQRKHTGFAGSDLVIPTKPVTALVLASSQANELRKTNAIMSNTNNPSPDNMHGSIEVRLSRFLHALGGYQLFGQTGHQSMPINAGVATCMMGLGEQARQNNYALSVEVGPAYNPLTMLCDLVVEPTKPVDAGMWKFCHTCAICAQQCPSDSISVEKEPSYEIPLTEGRPTVYKTPGAKLFWINMVSCRMYTSEFDGCAPKEVLPNDHGGGRSCYAVCPFGEDRAALAHNLIRATAATTSLFNGFFASMADVFGTGQTALRPDDWWDMELPALAMPTHIRATKGQWKM